jgi:hypothetical protein
MTHIICILFYITARSLKQITPITQSVQTTNTHTAVLPVKEKRAVVKRLLMGTPHFLTAGDSEGLPSVTISGISNIEITWSVMISPRFFLKV